MQELETTEQFLAVLDGFPTAFPAGERFAYCNGGFVVLALLAERASGIDFHDLVDERVLRPAGMVDSDFLRSDDLPGRAALGYVDERPSTNVFHLPVRRQRRRRHLHDDRGHAPVLGARCSPGRSCRRRRSP